MGRINHNIKIDTQKNRHTDYQPILDDPLRAFSFSLRVRAFTLDAATFRMCHIVTHTYRYNVHLHAYLSYTYHQNNIITITITAKPMHIRYHRYNGVLKG